MAKATIKLSYGDDLRRLTVDAASFTFVQLQETIRRLYTSIPATEKLVIKYQDDEDDLVTISTNEELAEAFNVSGRKNPPVLRLFLKDSAPACNKGESNCCGGETNSCSNEDEGCQRRGGRGRPWWARRGWGAQQGRRGGQGCPMWRQFQQQEANKTAEVDPALPKTLQDPRHAHELNLTANPYGHGHWVCDGCQLAGSGASYHCKECSFDLHVNCRNARESANPWQRRQQWFRLHQEALKAMEGHSKEGLEKARALLKEQAEISPFHRMTPIYNLACVEALLGNADDALRYLQESVAAGWSDANHIKNDTDLVSLRALDAFKALISSLESETDSEEEVTVEVNVRKSGPKEEEVKAETVPLVPLSKSAPQPAAPIIVPHVLIPVPAPVPVPIPSPAPVLSPVFKAAEKTAEKPAEKPASNAAADFDEKLKTLEEMGWADRRRNITALVLNRGDLFGAVQYLLDGSVGVNRQ